MLKSLSTMYRSWAFKLTSWLLLAAIAGGLTFMVWVASAVKPSKVLNQKNVDNPIVVDPLTLLANHNPDEMKDLVKPISFTAVIRDMRNYPKEFKDSRFVKSNADKWTLQIMNVVEHEVITDYLNGRTNDRDKFNYFRVVDENNQKRFVLTYGMYNSPQEALSAAKTNNFNLPNNVTAFPEEFKLYLSQMDEYEITPPLQDIGKDTPRDVKLQSTKKQLPPPKAKPETKKTENSEKAKPTTTEDKPQKPSIEKSTNQDETLNIQEKRANPERSKPKPAVEETPLKVQKTAPPPMEFDTPKEKPTKEKPVREKPAKEKVVKERPSNDSADSGNGNDAQ